MDYFKSLIKQRDDLCERASGLVGRSITRRLKLLNAHYPRHKFTFLQGMGSTMVIVKPPIQSLVPASSDKDCSSISAQDLALNTDPNLLTYKGFRDPARAGQKFLEKNVCEILSLAEELEIEFNSSVDIDQGETRGE